MRWVNQQRDLEIGEGELVETFGEKERGLGEASAMARDREMRDRVNERKKHDI